MNNLPLASRITRSLAAGLLGALLTIGPTQAQSRNLPANVDTGVLTMGVFPQGAINGTAVRFGAGARIFNAANHLVLPASLSGKQPVAYVVDFQGLVKQVWIITAAEAAALKKRKR